MQTTKPKFARKSLVLAASFVLLVATLPTTGAASEGPAVIATISLGPNADATAFALAVNPNTNKTYVTPGLEPLGCDSHIVSVIDNRTNTVLAPITVGLSPFGVAVNPKMNKIYVANAGGAICTDETANTVSAIEGSTDAVQKTITLNRIGPAFAAVKSKTNQLYDTTTRGRYTDGDTVAVIAGSRDTV